MIDHLKKIHRILYLPRVDKPVKPSFKVTPITEPYLYTDTNLYVDAFDSPIQSVKAEVSNIGGGNLYVERIRIPQAYGKWVKRAESPKTDNTHIKIRSYRDRTEHSPERTAKSIIRECSQIAPYFQAKTKVI